MGGEGGIRDARRGRHADADRRQPIGKLAADGKFTDAFGEQFTVRAGSVELAADKKVVLSEDGHFLVDGHLPKPGLVRVDGATTPGRRRAALEIAGLHYGDAKKFAEITSASAF